ncbi:E3 ubiquitin-protein ligase RSL1-like [Gastrolobium bilobum]|uniref:E3 ubiquitin-protein ligase RSL1-like n=1 Tax=Gastrolobium bilobum TaxID=150636 RepID=UPI002AB108F0|nr:E3 ubiquitin-protein ligase RSL1-like [Gastrolobium bilobum]XP_061356007.1 E3 ubiquitin-protein ligase RSL1-like [Gastrolobium bilobum]XP_061356008.1 E3 ubiquitin-protein ligase RSL1-like [Gastrolobium bilobum]
MEDQAVLEGVGREEEEDEFCSCCEDDDEVCKEVQEEKLKDELDEFSVKLFFKGLSISGVVNSGSGFSGIGVFMERASSLPVIRVQKRLDFYAEEPLVDYLALMDGLLEATRNKIRRVYAFTDSELLYNQITLEKNLEMPLLMALRERILELASNFEAFILNHVPSIDLEQPLQLAKVAIGLVTFPVNGQSLLESCSICCEDKPMPIMVTMKCLHKFCSHCLKAYVDSKVQSCQVPIRCPEPGCKNYISATECRSFLPFTSFESFEKALAEASLLYSDRIYCPFPNCSVLIDPHKCLSARASSSSQSDNSCVECPVCQRFICVDCKVPWHSSMSCEEFQNLPEEDRDASDITLHRLAQNNRWKRCQQCRRMIELTQGCYHMTCWCGHEFCYSCGAEYRDGQQTCQCAFWDEDNSEDSASHSLQESEQWAWETFNSIPMITDAYSDQEQSQLALIQRFLTGGLGLSDHHSYQSPPPRCSDSYVDAIKDLHQLPWLESFVSVISDDYEDYFQ